jgi:hypothetical protein
MLNKRFTATLQKSPNNGTHKLPIKSELLKLIKKSAVETVTVRLVERITN